MIVTTAFDGLTIVLTESPNPSAINVTACVPSVKFVKSATTLPFVVLAAVTLVASPVIVTSVVAGIPEISYSCVSYCTYTATF